MTSHWGEAYFDHFVKHFGDPISRDVFRQDTQAPSIQVLSYDNVFPGCRVFATLGVSRYVDDLGRVAEVILPIDGGWEDVPAALANSLFYMIQHRMFIGRGMAINGLERVSPNLLCRYGKNAMYITAPFGLPPHFESVFCGGSSGSVMLGILISKDEFEYFVSNGAEAFETMLESQSIDPYMLGRDSVV